MLIIKSLTEQTFTAFFFYCYDGRTLNKDIFTLEQNLNVFVLNLIFGFFRLSKGYIRGIKLMVERVNIKLRKLLCLFY